MTYSAGFPVSITEAIIIGLIVVLVIRDFMK